MSTTLQYPHHMEEGTPMTHIDRALLSAAFILIVLVTALVVSNWDNSPNVIVNTEAGVQPTYQQQWCVEEGKLVRCQ